MTRVDIYRIVRSVPLLWISFLSGIAKSPRTHEEHRVGDLMLADSSAEDDHASLLALDGEIIETSNVGDDIDAESGIGFVGVKVHHVPQ